MSGPSVPSQAAPQPRHVRYLFDPRATLTAIAGQRRRFADAVATLDDAELSEPSRCEGWTVCDLLRHGVWADGAMRSIWSGDRSLAEGFDPRRTPDEFVRSARALPGREVLRRYLASTEAMVAELESATEDRFAEPSLSPLGDVPWWLSAVHLGWDTSVHERDALLPLGRSVEAGGEEEAPVLAYALVLAAVFAGPDPLAVRVGPVRLRRESGPVEVWLAARGATDKGVTELVGDPAGVVDALSGRAPIFERLSGPTAVVERLGGMARYFTSPR